jgi:hypothetical protein
MELIIIVIVLLMFFIVDFRKESYKKQYQLDENKKEICKLTEDLSWKEKELGWKDKAIINVKREMEECVDAVNSLPLKVGELTVFLVKNILVREQYDSDWEIYTIDSNNNQITLNLTRHDTEDHAKLISCLKNCSSIEDIKKLDLRDRIYYD